jgi:site-specific DNA recombinase
MSREKRYPEKEKRVGIWIRVSTDDQARGESPEHHEKRARYYAESKDWKVVTVYHLEGVSGKAVLQNPEAQRMLADVKSGQISGLIFSKIARLARNTRELLDLADVFAASDADLISLQEAIDTSTPAGRLFYTIIAAMAQWEREEIGERVAASIPIRAKLGKPLGGAAPFGYRWKDRKLVLDDAESPVRRLMFELFAEHKRKRTVARLLNDAGHRTRSGGKFTAKSVERLVVDPIAKGSRRANYRTSPGRGLRVKPPSDWVYTDAPAIVSDELWAQCNEINASQKSPTTRSPKKGAHLFSGLVWCEKCAKKMYVLWQGKSYVCGKCRNKVGEDDLEVVFIEQLKRFVLAPDLVQTQLEKSDEQLSQKQSLLKTLESERTGVASEMEKVYRLYVGDQISGALFAERNTPLEARRRELEDEVPRLQADIDVLKLQLLSSTEILAESLDLCTRWTGLAFDDRRQIIENVVERISITDNEITIQLAYLPTPPKQPSPPASPQDGANGTRTVTDWPRPPAGNAQGMRRLAQRAR